MPVAGLKYEMLLRELYLSIEQDMIPQILLTFCCFFWPIIDFHNFFGRLLLMWPHGDWIFQMLK